MLLPFYREEPCWTKKLKTSLRVMLEIYRAGESRALVPKAEIQQSWSRAPVPKAEIKWKFEVQTT